MLHNYIKLAFRNLWRSRQFSVINILGLALGITVFLFITQYVAFEWSANRFNKNYNTLYRANYQYKEGNTSYYLPPGLAPVVKQKVTGIETYVRVADGIGAGMITVSKEDNNGAPTAFREDKILYVEGNFLNVFSFPLLEGNASLQEQKTLAISESMRKKLFGNNLAAGKLITVSNQFGNTDYTVAAVYKDMPEQSDIKADVLLSLHTLESAANRDGNDWADPNGIESGYANIYLHLNKEARAEKVTNDITAFIHSVDPKSINDKVFLQAFKHLHLAPSFNYPFQTYGSLLMVTVFSGVAVLILLIGWINYINLSTAQALNRAKEVGVRKVLGARRSQLIGQYLSETFFITLASVATAIILVSLLQPLFNDFTGKNLSLSILNTGWFWLAGVLLICAGSLFSGGYVTCVLSSFKPVKTLRGKIENQVKTFSLRKALVVFQFTISIVFIIATIILYRQLQYMHTENLGMKLDQLLVIKGPTLASEDQAEKNVAFKNQLGQLPFVNKYSASNNVPGIGYNFSTEEITKLNPQKGDERKSYSMFISDENFFDTYGIEFARGHTFSSNDAERSWNNVQKVIINEKAAATLGFRKDDNIIGEKMIWSGKPYEIIGVVKDYHHLSLREAIKPTVYLGSVSFSYFTVQTDSRNMQTKINTLKSLYTRSFSGNPFEYFFADDVYDKQYTAEQKLGNVFIAAACTAIFIACLGLFGLATFSARQRVKEIGIRKVLGAGVADITALISKDFIKLVIISIIIASPIAWYAMNKWLQDFAYRTHISWTIFFIAGSITIFIALATISFQAVKAAMANPIKSLRTE